MRHAEINSQPSSERAQHGVAEGIMRPTTGAGAHPAVYKPALRGRHWHPHTDLFELDHARTADADLIAGKLERLRECASHSEHLLGRASDTFECGRRFLWTLSRSEPISSDSIAERSRYSRKWVLLYARSPRLGATQKPGFRPLSLEVRPLGVVQRADCIRYSNWPTSSTSN
jgi:hypothetical protein